VEFLPVRYPPDAGAVWKRVPAARQDALIDEFLADARAATDPGELAAMRAALTPDEVETLLVYSRRRVIDRDSYRAGPLDPFLLIDPDRPDLPRAEIESTAWLARGFLARTADRTQAGAGAEIVEALLPGSPAGAAGPDYRPVRTRGEIRVLYDLHAERPHSMNHNIDWVIDLAEVTEFKGYRVESITLCDDGPDLLAEAATGDGPAAEALGQAVQRSAVRAGPRPGGRTGRLEAHLIRTRTEDHATELAARTETLYAGHGAVLTRVDRDLCLILLSDGSDPLESYGFVLRTLLGGDRSSWWHFEPDPPVDEHHTLLVMDVDYSDDGTVHHWWLAGPPAHGTHPDPDGAWQALIDDGDPFRGFWISTQDYHGPQRATVRGFWRGTWVDHEFRCNVGAGAAEWARLGPFLQPDGFPPPPP
jgi:hypothetical protein